MPVFLSKNLSYLRKIKSLTQKEIAEEIGVNHSAYGNYENNYSEPKLEIIERITKFLGVSAQAILFTDMRLDSASTDNQDSLIISKKQTTANSDVSYAMQSQIDNLSKEIKAIKRQLKNLNLK